MTNTNRLAALAADIRRDQQDLEGSLTRAAANAVYIGQALLEAKSLLPHGKWQSWLEENCSMSQRNARRYMQLASSGMEVATVADLGVKAATAALAVKRPVPAPSVEDREAMIEWIAMWRCMIFMWARQSRKDRNRIRMEAIELFASEPAGLLLISTYLRDTEEMEQALHSKTFDPFDMPVGDKLFELTKKATRMILEEGVKP